MDEKNNDGQNEKRRTKKTKKERERKWVQEFLQIWEIKQLTGVSISKIKKAIKDKDLKTKQTCERGMHLCHIDEVNRWLSARKGR